MAPPPPTADDLSAEQTSRQVLAGRFQILGLIGAGAMGTVYKVRDLSLDEIVALKTLRQVEGMPDVIERFRKEVKLARKVTHPNVARTFDIGEDGQDRFLTMEYIEGESLRAVLDREGVLPLASAIQIAVPICAGLQAAHEAGVVHRDLKPDNVLISTSGRVVITDFGIARSAVDSGGSTQSLGTPDYMAPEQVQGGHVDARTDLYALGVMLYEMLTGQRPFAGTPLQVAAARLFKPPPDPRERKPEVPASVAALVMKLLSRQPEDRHARASDVRRALLAIADDLDGAELTLTPLPEVRPPAASAPAAAVAPTVAAAPLLAAVASTEPHDAREMTLAVLPCRNAGAADDEHWADGFTDDLIETLSTVPGLKVRSRGAVFGYKRSERDPREIGAELGVRVVVEGSVRRHAGRLRVTLRLVGVADGFQIWARRFERADGDLLAIADEAAQAIADALQRPCVIRAERGDRGGRDAEALDLYLRARQRHHSFTREGVLEARDLFERALERAPADPAILSGYALAEARLWVFSSESASRDRAQKAARKALELAPERGEPHMALAALAFQENRIETTLAELRLALAREPNLAEAHEMVARLLFEVGSVTEGIARLERALAIEPAMERARWDLARAHVLQGNWAPAEALLGRDEQRYGQWLHHARLLLWRRDAARARRLLADVEAKSWVFPVKLLRVVADRRIDPDDQQVLETAALEGPPRRRLFFRQLEVEGRVYLGDVSGAVQALERAIELGLIDINWLERCPLLGPLRADPRYPVLRGRVDAAARRVFDLLAR